MSIQNHIYGSLPPEFHPLWDLAYCRFVEPMVIASNSQMIRVFAIASAKSLNVVTQLDGTAQLDDIEFATASTDYADAMGSGTDVAAAVVLTLWSSCNIRHSQELLRFVAWRVAAVLEATLRDRGEPIWVPTMNDIGPLVRDGHTKRHYFQ